MPTSTHIKLQNKKVPKLRFPGFSDAWEENILSDIVSNYGGTSLEEYASEKGSHKFISIGNYSTDGKYVDNGQKIVLNDKTKNKLLDKGDLTMVLNDKTAVGDIIGSTILIDKENTYIYNQRSERIVADKNKVSSIFLWAVLNSRLFRKKVFKISQGGTQIYVNFPAVKKLKINIPPFSEQQKIAEFLGVVDSWIENLKMQKEDFESYKKGMMQNIFSQKISFKDADGKNFPKWEERKMRQLVSMPVSDGPHSTPKFLKSGIPFLSVDNLVNNNVDLGHIRYISKADHAEFSKKCKPQNGDLLLGKAASVGQVAVANLDFEFNIWSPIAVIRPKKDYNVNFLYFYFQTTIIKKQIRKLINTSSQENLGMGDINEIIFSMPIYFEQQKIAEFLTSIDKIIESKQQQITQAEAWKHGLMQGLFV